MKKLFILVFAVGAIGIGIPALLLSIMYDGTGDVNMPTHLYTEDASAEGMIFTELYSSIEDVEDNVTDNMVYELHQDIINTAIFEMFRGDEQNPDYMPTDDCTEDSCNYVFATPIPIEGLDIDVRVVGAWVEFEADMFIANLYLEVGLNDGFTYKTVISVHFNFYDYPDRYELELDKIQIGGMPVSMSFVTKILNSIDASIDSFDLSEGTEVSLGELDLSNMSYTLLKDDILTQLDDSQNVDGGDTGSALTQEVLSIVFENELVEFVLVEDKFILTAKVEKLRNDETDIPNYLYDLHFVETVGGVEIIGEFDPDSFDPDSYLVDKFTEYVFHSALVGGGFKIYEETFNKLIYYNATGFEETRKSYEYENSEGDIEVLDLGLKAIWFELEPDEIYVYALFRIAGIDSVLKITAEEISTSDQELVFEFVEITFGEDDEEELEDFLSIVNLEAFNQLFLDLEDVEFGEFVEEDGTVVLKITALRLSQMMQDGSQAGVVNVTGISLIQDAIVLDIEPADDDLALVLTSFTNELNDVFEDPALLTGLSGVLDEDTPGPEQDVYNGVVDLQDALANEEEIQPEDIAELFSDFGDMDSDAQEDFLETFNDLVDEDIYDQFAAYFEAQSGSSD
ncbi:MAG: hypothetical protein KAH16_01105 [Candidatus Izimaplasma sp.]|nr:hypothetical protein [Candidatus Izimaplasma bacterium]